MTLATDVQAGDHAVQYGDQIIRFGVRVQLQRTVQRNAIHVEPDGRVLVDAPAGASQAAVATRPPSAEVIRSELVADFQASAMRAMCFSASPNREASPRADSVMQRRQ